MVEQRRGPAEPACLQEPLEKALLAGLSQQTIDQLPRSGIGRAAQRERNSSKRKIKQPVTAPRLEVVIAFGRSPRDQFDLTGVEPEPLVDIACLRLDRAIIRKEYT